MQRTPRLLTPFGGVPLWRIAEGASSSSGGGGGVTSMSTNMATSSIATVRLGSVCKSCALGVRRARSSPPLIRFQQRRHYAKEVGLETSKHQAGPDLSWPTANPGNPYELPTPYQIFKMDRSAPYSKSRFYELVKLYHPDRPQSLSSTNSEPLSASSKLERYRMVIAANELLSDPRRRRLYDAHGIGWHGRPDFGPSRPRWADANDRRWSGFDDNVNSPRNNATWEDWERWYMRNERTHGEQRPVYMNNGTFVLLLVLAAGAATMGEAARVGEHSRMLIMEVERSHDASSKDLMRRRRESHGYETADERTRNFLRIRGPQGLELETAPVGQEREGSVFVPDEEESGS